MAHSIPLPQLPDGRTYITKELVLNNPEVYEFFQRTRNSWAIDWQRDIVIMYPSIERKQRFVEVAD